MFTRILILAILILTTAASETWAQSRVPEAQTRTASPYNRGDDIEPNESMLETRYRWRVREEEKEHRELLTRTSEASQLSEAISVSVAVNNIVTSADTTKLNNLEKLLKKVRRGLNGDDDDDKEEPTKPASIVEAAKRLAELGALVDTELKEVSRHEISADAIVSINEMLDLVVYLRGGSRSK